MSTSFQNILKLILLFILIVVFIVYLYTNRVIKETKVEGFSSNPYKDIKTDYFDLSANYNMPTDAEIPVPKIVNPEIPPILDIGSGFGGYDPAKMPWDAENKELKQSEALWGIPSADATIALFTKVNFVNQAQDPGALPFNAQTQQMKFTSPTFNYGTNNDSEAAAFMAADAALPMAAEMIASQFIPVGPLDEAHDLINQQEALKELGGSKQGIVKTYDDAVKSIQGNTARSADEIRAALKNLDVEYVKNLNKVNKQLDEAGKALTRIDDSFRKSAGKAADIYLNAAADAARAGRSAGELATALKIMNTKSSLRAAKLFEAFNKSVDDVFKGVKGGLLKALKVAYKFLLEPFVLKFKQLGARAVAGVKAVATAISSNIKPGSVTSRLAAAATGAAARASKIGLGLGKAAAGIATKAAAVIQKIMSNVIARTFGNIFASLTSFKLLVLVGQFLISSGINPVSGAWFVLIGNLLDYFYMLVIMPLMIILTLPDGPLTKAMEKLSDPTGCCPRGTVPMDQVIPEALNMVLGMIPIVGDIIGVLYPYLCIPPPGEFGPPKVRMQLILPKYINSEPALTTQWIDWPDYDCSSGAAKVVGKEIRRDPSGVPPRGPDGFINGDVVFNWSVGGYPYTNLSAVVASPIDYKQVTKIMNGFTPEYKEQLIGRPGMPMYFSDFSEPTALVEMAQYYYDNAILSPVQNSDASITISYISKINYVVASSLFSCDVSCEMINATFDAVNGLNYREITTYNHDRRFYFATTLNQPGIVPNPDAAYWGTTDNPQWMAHDDKVDSTLYILNDYINNADYFNNNYLKATVLATAYQLVIESEASYKYARDTDSPFAEGFKEIYDLRVSDYEAFIKSIVKPSVSYGTVLNNTTLLVKNYLNAQDRLYQLHVSQRPYNSATPLRYNNPTYVIRGCTFLDSTASGAYEPDISNFEDDTRQRVNFDVKPFLKRGNRININTLFCASKDNLKDVIESYKIQEPSKRIKTINKIESLGKNVCSFKWDEVSVDAEGKETNYRTVVNNILYQQDLSACIFVLPKTVSGLQDEKGKKTLYGTVVAGVASDTLAIPPTSIKLYPLTVGTANINSNLQYIQASHYRFISYEDPGNPDIFPPRPPDGPTFQWVSNVDIVPRYDPLNYSNVLPRVVRPKKPIRVKYPVPIEVETLGNIKTNFCSKTENMSNFIVDYGTNINNKDKILKIVRAYTVSSNVCSYEVDILIASNSTNFSNATGKPTIERRTLSYRMKPEGFTNYTYSNVLNYDGLQIQSGNPDLNPPNSEGYNFTTPYINKLRNDLVSNVTYFNDELIKQFTAQTRSMKEATASMLYSLVGTQYLGDGTGKKRCKDPEIMQRIMEKYNNDNYPTGRLNQTQNIMYSIFQSSTADSNTCHLYFANSNQFYTDFYAVNPTDSNNYIGNFGTPMIKEVKMIQLSPTLFIPADSQTYKDVAANDVSILSDSLLTEFYTSKRPKDSCVPVNCLDPYLIDAAKRDYSIQTGNIISGITSTLPIGNNICDYRVVTTINDPSLASAPIPGIDAVLRVRYRPQPYSISEPSCTYEYKPSFFDTTLYSSDSLQLQFALNIDPTDPHISPLLTMNTGEANSLDSKILRNPINFN